MESTSLAAPESVPLVALRCHVGALIKGIDGDIDAQAWLAAVGIGCGEKVTVLRRAPFGGPLHVRTGTGGEFAIDATLAGAIHVAPQDPPPTESDGIDDWVGAELGTPT